MEVAASVIAVVQLSDRVVSLCGKYAFGVKDAREDIQRLSNEITEHLVVVKRVDESNREPLNYYSTETTQELKKCLEDCRLELTKLEKELTSARAGFWPRALIWPLRSKDIAKVVETLRSRRDTIHFALTADQHTSGKVIERNRQIEKLAFAEGARFDSTLWEQKPTCLQDTRVDLLHRIEQWATEPHAPGIFWLRGMAGTGKSTVACTVAGRFAAENRLGASFFFSRGQADLSDVQKFSTTVASQLARAIPSLASHIAAAVSADPQILQRGVHDQWKHLVVKPLCSVKEGSGAPHVSFLVIDALDECDGRGGGQEPSSDIQLVLELLSELKESQKALQLRVFLTSRPEIEIRQRFRHMPADAHQDFSLHDIEDTITQSDIRRYLSHELNEFRLQHGISDGWPKQEEIDMLTKSANNLFIYAATVCRFLRSSRLQPPAGRLAPLLLGKPTTNSPNGELDRIYTQVLRAAVIGSSDPEESEGPTKQFRSIFGPLILLYNMLDPSSLATLLALQESLVRAVLSNLQAIVDIPEDHTAAVQLLHPSLRDFLLDRQRCSDLAFWIDQRCWHEELFIKCLRVMSGHLRKDICGLSHPGTRAAEVDRRRADLAIPYHVQYACRYWVNHLQYCDFKPDSLERTYEFLSEEFLYWLESLSLLGLVSEAVLLIKQLKTFFSTKADQVPELTSLLYDAKRFVLKNRSIIETAPLQTYSSAMIFTPYNSQIRRIYKKETSSWIVSGPLDRRDWDPSLQSLEGHSDYVNAVAFSPDGKLVASTSRDNTVRLWNSMLGSETQKISASGIYRLRFSHDGSYLSTNMEDVTISSPSDSNTPQKCHGDPDLFVDQDWVKFQGRDLLWLPHDYRPTCVATQNGLLVLGQSSGRVSFTKFSVHDLRRLGEGVKQFD